MRCFLIVLSLVGAILGMRAPLLLADDSPEATEKRLEALRRLELIEAERAARLREIGARDSAEGAALESHAQAELAKLVAIRADKLQAGIKSGFSLSLSYNGEQDKPFYNLRLATDAKDEAKTDPFNPLVSITADEATKLVKGLPAQGFLKNGGPPKKGEAPSGRGYVLLVKAGEFAWEENLGWGLPMSKKLDQLKSILPDPAAKSMGMLLARLTGLRAEWEKAAVKGG